MKRHTKISEQTFWHPRCHRPALQVIPVIVLVGLVGALAWRSLSNRHIVLTFLTYTNNAVTRVAVFEITNRFARDLDWSLHVNRQFPEFIVAVTDLMTTNGALDHIGGQSPMTLSAHASLRFATDELRPGDRVWVKFQPYPPTRAARRRERMAFWFYNRGWHGVASRVRPGTWVSGPVLP